MARVSLSRNADVREASEALAQTLGHEYEIIGNSPKLTSNVVNKLRVFDPIATDPSIAHLQRIHLSLISNVASIRPSEIDSPIDHLGFIEALLRTRLIAGARPGTLKDVDLLVESQLDTAVRELATIRKFGSDLIDRWYAAEGEYYGCTSNSKSIIGRIPERTDNDLLDGPNWPIICEYQQPKAATQGKFADWLLGVDGDYAVCSLLFCGVEDPLATWHFSRPFPTLGVVSAIKSPYLQASLSQGVVSRGFREKFVTGLALGNVETRELVESSGINRSDKVAGFLRASEPPIAGPLLRSVMEGGGYTDNAELYGNVHYQFGTHQGKRTHLTELGRSWLKELGLAG
jgi:hypothetical protein